MKTTLRPAEATGGKPDAFNDLSKCAPDLAEMFVRLSSDIALVIDASGRIERVVQSDAQPIEAANDWVGRPWVDTVTGDTRQKIEKILKEVTTTGLARRREINHPVGTGAAIPMAYTALRLGIDGPVLAVGRDLRAVAAIQQKFLEAQRDTEQSYWKARETASRYELLFQVATDAMMLVDSDTLQVVEANRAAAELFEVPAEEMPGRNVVVGFDRRARAALEELMESTRTSGKQFEVRARLAGKLIHTFVAITPFRVMGALRLLVRVRVDDDARTARLLTPGDRLEQHRTEAATAAVVVTDSTGTIVTANAGFLKLVLAPTEEQVKSQPLAGWLESGSFANLVGRVRDEGLVQGKAHLVQIGGPTVPVEMSATVLADDDQERIGFTFYPTGPATSESDVNPLDIITGWLGATPLDVLVQRASALFERHLIAKALERTAGDTAAAAELLSIEATELARRRGRD
ncbi:MAG: PAS domain-containing protein [Labilithrix sp.]